MVDIHCHMIPGIDDGAKNLAESLEMARMAVADGIGAVIVTPHQLGNFKHNTGDVIRKAVRSFQLELKRHKIPLKVLPGGDVRIEEGMTQKIVAGEVMSLGDHKRHVLLELPHELYFPLEPILKQLARQKMVGILSHPERNQGILRQRNVLPALVDAGCLMQVTAGSLVGGMGRLPEELSRWMLESGLVHFLATDAHSPKTRRPKLRRAYDEVASMLDEQTAHDLCVANPLRVALAKDVPAGRRPVASRPRKKSKSGGWFGLGKAS